jgi:hypothetical protein
MAEQPIARLGVRETAFALQLHVVDGVDGGTALHFGARLGSDINNGAQVFAV